MAKYTIKLKSYLNIHDEKTAAAALTPGHLIELASATTVQKHSTAGGPAERMFALEDQYQGREISDAYNTTTYKTVICWIATPGDVVYATFDSTSGNTLAAGDFLESAGDGTLRKYTAQASGGAAEATNAIVGVALEAVTTPGARFKCRIV